jgi:hypothetical protein
VAPSVPMVLIFRANMWERRLVMIGPIRFIFVVIWFAIGLGIAGTLKDCTAIMANKAAIAHQHGGISYGWWNRRLVVQ